MSERVTKSYSVEFKEQAVRQALNGGLSVAQTARNLGVNENPLHTWINKYSPTRGKSSEAANEPMYDELKRLRKENQRLRQERDLLKKAAAYFASHSS